MRLGLWLMGLLGLGPLATHGQWDPFFVSGYASAGNHATVLHGLRPVELSSWQQTGLNLTQPNSGEARLRLQPANANGSQALTAIRLGVEAKPGRLSVLGNGLVVWRPGTFGWGGELGMGLWLFMRKNTGFGFRLVGSWVEMQEVLGTFVPLTGYAEAVPLPQQTALPGQHLGLLAQQVDLTGSAVYRTRIRNKWNLLLSLGFAYTVWQKSELRLQNRPVLPEWPSWVETNGTANRPNHWAPRRNSFGVVVQAGLLLDFVTWRHGH